MTLSLDAAFAALGVDPFTEGVQIVDASQMTPPAPFAPLLALSPTRPLLVCRLSGADSLAKARQTLATLYPGSHPVSLSSGQAVQTSTLAQLAEATPAPNLCAYLPALAMIDAVRTVDTLRYLTARLRAADGCPWDRQQTHESLKPFVLEETHEVLEALDSGNRAELCEELGDLLMQVMIHAQVAVENGDFDLNDVVAGIASKVIRRHPHVFGDVQVSGAQDVLRNWQSIKQAEKKGHSDEPPPSLLGSVPVQLPALAYAQAMQERAARVGFMQPDDDPVAAVCAHLGQARQATMPQERAEAVGKALFALTLAARGWDVQAEDALRLANRRQRQRFIAVEENCRQRGLDMQKLDDAQRHALWEESGR